MLKSKKRLAIWFPARIHTSFSAYLNIIIWTQLLSWTARCSAGSDCICSCRWDLEIGNVSGIATALRGDLHNHTFHGSIRQNASKQDSGKTKLSRKCMKISRIGILLLTTMDNKLMFHISFMSFANRMAPVAHLCFGQESFRRYTNETY